MGRPGRRWGSKFPHSDETKRKISEANKGRLLSDEHKAAISAGLIAAERTMSEENKTKLRARLLGKQASPETRLKMSLARKGKRSPAQLAVTEKQRGVKRTLSPEHRQLLALRNKERALPEEERKRRRKEASRSAALGKRYNITIAQYNAILEQQGGVCALCKQPCLSGLRLAVDHHHQLNKVRGLLCRKCNRGIGNFRDNAGLLLAAADYLERR